MGHNCYCFLWGVLFWLLRWLWDASRLNISSKLLDQVSSIAPVIVSVGKRSIAKNKCPESFLSVVKKIFEKLVNNKMLDHLEICCLFSDFQYGLLTLNEPRISESCIVIKIKLNFYFTHLCGVSKVLWRRKWHMNINMLKKLFFTFPHITVTSLYYITKGQRLGDAEKSTLMN